MLPAGSGKLRYFPQFQVRPWAPSPAPPRPSTKLVDGATNLVATSFTDQHGEDGVLSFEDTSPRRQQQTMTSREIADLTGSTHDNVLKTVRRLVLEGGVFKTTPTEGQYTHGQNGQTYAEFHLGGYWLENQQTKELIAEIEKAGIPALLSIPPWPRDTGCRCNRRV